MQEKGSIKKNLEFSRFGLKQLYNLEKIETILYLIWPKIGKILKITKQRLKMESSIPLMSQLQKKKFVSIKFWPQPPFLIDVINFTNFSEVFPYSLENCQLRQGMHVGKHWLFLKCFATSYVQRNKWKRKERNSGLSQQVSLPKKNKWKSVVQQQLQMSIK